MPSKPKTERNLKGNMKVSVKLRLICCFFCIGISGDSLAQSETFSEVTVTERILMSGSGARGLHLTAPWLAPDPLSNSTAPGLLLWNGGRRSFFSGYYLSSDITNDLLLRNYSAAFGYRSLPKGAGAFAAGHMSVAGTASIGVGSYSEALGSESVAMGRYARAEGNRSLAIGHYAKALGVTSVALGNYAEASGANSFAVGNHSLASGSHSVSLGDSNDAVGAYSFTSGRFSWASGFASSANGYGVDASHENTFVVGRYNNPLSGVSSSERPMFIVGNGASNTSRSNALEVRYNGEVHIQKIPPKGGISMGNFQ